MTPWFKNVTPHQDVRDGVLDESVFAADLSELALAKMMVGGNYHLDFTIISDKE